MKQYIKLRTSPGWDNLIAEYSEKIEALGAINYQVNEKYGYLDFYSIQYAPDADAVEIQRLIEEVNLISETICQGCGKPGHEVEHNSWIRTYCDDCFANWREGQAILTKSSQY